MDYTQTAGYTLMKHEEFLRQTIRAAERRGRRSDAADREQRDRLAASDRRPSPRTAVAVRGRPDVGAFYKTAKAVL